jgi:murein DD-endopeptidase MepM/ murein hydrolase activator NlpD
MKININIEPFSESIGDFFHDLVDWSYFLYNYFRRKIIIGITNFEKVKDILVDFLIVKRGRYSKHFLNISFLFLIAGAVVVSPIIAQYYPSVFPGNNSDQLLPNDFNYTQVIDKSATTSVSDKGRFDIIDYEVSRGDTLASIAEKFGISINTIKWANSLKTEKLIPGQSLRIPPVTGIVHKVAPGDSVYSLAKKYKSDSQKIADFPANDFADLETFALNIGQIIFIPDGVMPEAAPIYQPAPVPQFIAGVGGKFLWPTQGIITQYPVSYHMAVDIANQSRPPVVASDGGIVSYAGCLTWGYGCHVIINHADGFQTLYGHLSVYNVNTGDKVGRGQVIGRMGSTGRSTGTHTHFEVRRNGVLLNPLLFLK